jgi:hypothetical protein
MKPVLSRAFLSTVGFLLYLPAIAQDYSPLQVGNRWFNRSLNLSPSDSTVSSPFRVTGDTLFTGGQRYFELDSANIMGGRFKSFFRANVGSPLHDLKKDPYHGSGRDLLRFCQSDS